jgi:hypothetical protein
MEGISEARRKVVLGFFVVTLEARGATKEIRRVKLRKELKMTIVIDHTEKEKVKHSLTRSPSAPVLTAQ